MHVTTINHSATLNPGFTLPHSTLDSWCHTQLWINVATLNHGFMLPHSTLDSCCHTQPCIHFATLNLGTVCLKACWIKRIPPAKDFEDIAIIIRWIKPLNFYENLWTKFVKENLWNYVWKCIFGHIVEICYYPGFYSSMYDMKRSETMRLLIKYIKFHLVNFNIINLMNNIMKLCLLCTI
jgi:hypothetical protein